MFGLGFIIGFIVAFVIILVLEMAAVGDPFDIDDRDDLD